jgi:hypothetical protein
MPLSWSSIRLIRCGSREEGRAQYGLHSGGRGLSNF